MPILVLVYITWECSLAVKEIHILEIIVVRVIVVVIVKVEVVI